ncbi:MAG TPA: PAS domain-containing protein [Chthoniobacterales bacterium]|nr:PAS domain-containing protein [Chthoniobacterales bacterium]
MREVQEIQAPVSLPQTSRPGRNITRIPYEKIHRPPEGGTSESAQSLALAAWATNDAVRDWNVASGELAWPVGLESLLGYKPAAVSGELAFWQKNIHPDDRARIALSIRDALAHAKRWSGEYRFRRADGDYAHLLERATIVRDASGDAVRFVGSLMDITARKQLQDQLIRSQKMDAFGQLAGGVAHDFNNFLTTILGYSDLLLDELGLKGATAQHITEIRSAAKRASALTSQLLAFSRKQPLESRVVEVNGLVGNMERSLLRLLGDNISVECHLHASTDPAHIKVDPNQLTQIILNLAVNARDAMPQGGRLTLATGTLRITGQAQPPCCPEKLPPGDYALINVTDNGSGMTDEVKAHLFEPFFTTKDDRHGSGLGLATTYGIVRQSGGHICIDSEIGKGTMVTIYFPKVAAPPAPSYKKPGANKSPTGTETILVLEDDVSVRHISVRVLRALGYEVLEAATGDDAQRLVAYHDRKIDLLLTDMVMPQMSGRDFATWLHQINPETKVIFISGYLEESMLPADRRDQEMFFLPKPFDPDQLARKVREALDT